jgi:hypothetical protein
MADFSPYKKLIDSTTGGPGKDIPDNFLAGEAPKLKFNWTIQFNDAETGIDGSTTSMQSNFFAAKTADRPKPTIEYQEINSYNFRTRVAVRTDYGSCTAVFYDDASNHGHSLLTKYLKHVSPIANASGPDGLDTYQQNSSIGPLSRNLGAWKSIVITHYYLKNNSPKQTTYTYLNPKISTFDYGALDMTQSDSAEITVTFYYDAVLIQEG